MPAFQDLVDGVWESDTVTIYVGKDRKVCKLHKNLLCAKSPYFNTMFTEEFKEGINQTATDEEATIVAFERFILWLHTGNWFRVEVGQEGDDEVLIDFYILADRYMLPKELKDTVVRYLAGRVDRKPGELFGSGTVTDIAARAVYSGIKELPEDDPMRKGVIERACRALLPASNSTSPEEKEQWLVDCTNSMDTGLLRQFLRVYHNMSTNKITTLDAKIQILYTEEPGKKRQRPGGLFDQPTGGFGSGSGGLFGSVSSSAGGGLFGPKP